MVIPFNECDVVKEDEKKIKTIFFDGLIYDEPLNIDSTVNRYYQRETGHDSIENFIVSNHIFHTFIMEKLDYPYSPLFYSLSHGIKYKGGDWENAIVISFNRYMYKGDVDPILDDFFTGRELRTLKRESMKFL